MKLPLKVRLLEYAIEKDAPFTASQALADIGPEYEGERFCNFKFMEKLMRLFLGVNVFKEGKYELDENDVLQVEYQITDFGKGYYKCIPGHNK